MLRGFFALIGVYALLSTSAWAEDGEINKKHFGATIGASWEYGQLGDRGMGLPDRAMSAISIEALPGYHPNSKWFVGVDFNYLIESQLASLRSAGGTNLKGNAWLVGLGAQYRLTNRWSLQAAVDFLGQYKFGKQTANSEDDHLASPLNFRVKGQYFFSEHWSADGSVSYASWSDFHVAGTDHSQSASQWMTGVGVSYHFGRISFSHEKTASAEHVKDESEGSKQ